MATKHTYPQRSGNLLVYQETSKFGHNVIHSKVEPADLTKAFGFLCGLRGSVARF